MKRDELLTVRIDPELKGKIETLERIKLETKSNIVREALIRYIQHETEMKEVKENVSKKFASGKISFEQMVQILGYEEARKVAFFVEIAKKSFEEGLK
jgi:predicted transcriptional regulator